MQKVICRASNRFFVGLPLFRNEDYIDLNITFTIQVITSGLLIRLFPDFLKPIIGNLISPLPASTKRASKHLKIMLQERLAREEDTPGKPNDLISWLLDEAHGYRREIDDLILRLLTINFGAIHTTSMTLTATLNHLTIYPQYIDELRAEIESTVEEHGWTKFAMGRMRKLDSSLKEVQRFEPAGCYGTTVPAGVTVGVPVRAVQRDDACYPDGHIFNGFRFAEMRDGEGESLKHQMVTPTSDYFLFGNGRHACLGRFFAVNELKALVAYILLTYDIKAENEGGAEMKWYSVAAVQDNNAKFLFRKRRT
ncbi:cytochrome P450 [Marasmius fiardii PR-910]|nr:cytochrome P450 [Marasmius fiardii PR-910]